MSWTHLNEQTPVARKVYRCYLCERDIPIGDKHVKRTGIDDDGLCVTHMHTACELLTDDWKEDDWECHDAGEFREYLQDVLNVKGVVDE